MVDACSESQIWIPSAQYIAIIDVNEQKRKLVRDFVGQGEFVLKTGFLVYLTDTRSPKLSDSIPGSIRVAVYSSCKYVVRILSILSVAQPIL